MGMNFVDNSAAYSPDINTPLFIRMIIGMMVVACLIIAHSWSLHGRKWSSSRIQTELASFSTFASGILVIISLRNTNNATVWAVAYDFWYNGVCNLTVQLCDNYMFLSRYCAVAKVPRWKLIIINLYIYFVIICMWSPAYLIVPFFFDTNTNEFANVYFYALYVSIWGNVAYNFYFTFEFSRILFVQYGRVGVADQSNQRIRIIAVKSICHCITSSTATVVYCYLPVYGIPIFNILLIAGMHIWFNCWIQEYIYCTYYCIYVCCCPREKWQKLLEDHAVKLPVDYLSDQRVGPEVLVRSQIVENRQHSSVGGTNAQDLANAKPIML